jgi:hypothetical protein
MKRWNIAITAAALMLLASVTLHAQGKGGGSANKPPKQNTSQSVKPQTTKSSPTTQAKAPKTSQTTKTAQGPKTQSANAHPTKTQSTKTQSTKTQSTKTQPAKTAQNTKPSTKGSKASTATNASNTTTTGTTSGTGTSNTEPNSSTPSPTNHVVLTPVQQKLTKNTNLAGKLQSRLPAGTDLMKAADGFRNLGQFVAAVNVSNNLDIPFRQLKTEMVKENLSLGQAIQKLKPTSSGTVEAQRAEYDAQGMIYQSEQQNTTTTTTTTSSKKSNKNSAGGGSDE